MVKMVTFMLHIYIYLECFLKQQKSMCFTPNINTQETVNILTCANRLTHFCAQQSFLTVVYLKSIQFFLKKINELNRKNKQKKQSTRMLGNCVNENVLLKYNQDKIWK